MSEISIPGIGKLRAQTAEESIGFLKNIEDALLYVGLYTPLRRFAGFSVITSVLMFLIKPGFAYTESGEARQWSMWSLSPESTVMPWWLFSILVGGAFAIFI
jgi:hypothetical protein